MLLALHESIKKALSKAPKLAVACFIAISLTAQKYFRFFTQWVDGASYVGMISSARDSMSLDPTLFRSIIEINKTTFAYTVQQWCSAGLSVPSASGSRVVQWHAYLIAYPLGAVSRVTTLPPALVAAFAESLAFVGAFLFVMSYMKKKNLTFSWRILWLLGTACSPVLVFGALGNLQPERLLLLPMVVIVISLENICRSEKISFLALGSAYTAALVISERSAFTAGWVTIAYLLLRNPRIIRTTAGAFSAFCGGTCLGWWYFWTKFIQSSPYYENVGLSSTVRGIYNSLTLDGAASAKMIFTIIPLLVFAIFRWQGFLVGLLSLIPNLAISIGGAEKTGLVFQYHAMYIAVLLPISAVGLVAFGNRRDAFRLRWPLVQSTVVAMACFAMAISFSYKPDLGLQLLPNSTAQFDQFRSAYGLRWPIISSTMWSGRNNWRQAVGDIPLGNLVSAPEWAMPALVDKGHKKLLYYPHGARVADVVIAESDPVTRELVFLPWLFDPKKTGEVGRCVGFAISSRKPKEFEMPPELPGFRRFDMKQVGTS